MYPTRGPAPLVLMHPTHVQPVPAPAHLPVGTFYIGDGSQTFTDLATARSCTPEGIRIWYVERRGEAVPCRIKRRRGQ